MNFQKARRFPMKLTKTDLSKLIKSQASLDVEDTNLRKMMFRNYIKDDSHFHLTYKGFQLMKYTKFKHYKIKLRDKINMRGLLNLDRECPCPYYLSKNKDYVYLFAQKPAVELQMMDGDLENFHI